MKKSKQGKFLLKYATLALGASMATGSSVGAEAQASATNADPGPSAAAKAPATSTAPGGGPSSTGSATQVPVSVVYGPPASMRGVGSIQGGSQIKGTSKIRPAEARKRTGDSPSPDKPAASEKDPAGAGGSGKK